MNKGFASSIAVAGALALATAPSHAAIFESQGLGFFSAGEFQREFGLTPQETQEALASYPSGYVYQEVTYTVTCEWTSTSGQLVQKSVDRYLIYKSGVNFIPLYVAGGRRYKGFGIGGGTGEFELIQDADLSFPNSACPSDAGIQTDDPAELNALVTNVTEPRRTRVTEVIVTYRGVERTFYPVAPEYNHF